MSLCYYDAQVLSKVLKKARKKLNITQAECAELLDFSLSYLKDLERCRCSPSIENFYHICKTLNISADDCIFPESSDKTDSDYYSLIRLMPKCDEKMHIAKLIGQFYGVKRPHSEGERS